VRIDPKSEICGYPVLLVRKTLRSLRAADGWGLLALEEAAKLSPGTGRAGTASFANAASNVGAVSRSSLEWMYLAELPDKKRHERRAAIVSVKDHKVGRAARK
jgi:hypothetical protein